MFFSPISSDAAVVKIGDTLTIGKWEQNGNAEDGAEPIKWKVVRLSDGKAILLADSILDMATYSATDASWTNSSIRTWLNDTFYNTAFSDKEKASIDKKKLLTRKADKSGFDKTEDYVYLLSDSEAQGYADVIKNISAKPSEVTSKKGLFVDKNTGYGYWWLRSPGSDTTHAGYVNPDGSVYSAGCKVNYAQFGGVRPAIEIDLTKSGFAGKVLKINYVYSDGKTAADSYVAGISAGEKYDVKSPEIKGYTADRKSVSGTMGSEDVTVKVVYKVTSSDSSKGLSAPEIRSNDKGEVVLKAVFPGKSGVVQYGYSLKNDAKTVPVWIKTRTFKGLVGGNTYYFFARLLGSDSSVISSSAGTAVYVQKTDRKIEAPQILNFNHNAVCATEITPSGGGVVVYGVSSSNTPGSIKNWSKYPVFNSLTPGVKYYLFAKVAETDNYKEAYSYTEFTTTTEKTATEIPLIKNVTESSIEVIPVELYYGNVLYGISESKDVSGVKTWLDSTTFTGLELGKRYYIFTKIENNSSYTNAVCSYSSAVTVSGERKAIKAEAESIVGVTVTMKPIVSVGSDFVYFGISLENDVNKVSLWQPSNVFENLIPNTEYYVFTRLSNGTVAQDLFSEGVLVKTGDRDSTVNLVGSSSQNDKGVSLWWIVLLIIAVVLLIVSGTYILVKKKIILKNFTGFDKLKELFTAAFKPINKSDEIDVYDDSAEDAEDYIDRNDDSEDDDFES